MKLKIFQYGDYQYQYRLLYQDRRTISLTVQPSLNIIIRCPSGHSKEKIEKFLKRKWYWLEIQIKELKKFQRKTGKKEYVSGESFLYLGRQYRLLIKKSQENNVGLNKGRIVVETDKSKSNKKLLEDWYQQKAEQIFKERYSEVLKKFDYEFTPKLTLRKMEKRWGSFLAKKKILLNPELIKASKECIDYVITHELCHMKYQNHGNAYYKFLATKCPDWKKIKDKLELRFL